MKAILKNYAQSPRKVRLVTDLIKGDSVQDALTKLRHIDKRAAKQITKILSSAVSNAETNDSKRADNLYVKDIRVDEGYVLKRFMPRARGRATPFRKRTSHISVTLDERASGAPTESETKTKKTKQTTATK